MSIRISRSPSDSQQQIFTSLNMAGRSITGLSPATSPTEPVILSQHESSIDDLQTSVSSNSNAINNHTLSLQAAHTDIGHLEKWFGSTLVASLTSKTQTTDGERIYYTPKRINNQSDGPQQSQTYTTSQTSMADTDYNFIGTPTVLTLNDRLYLGIPGFTDLKGTSDVGAPATGSYPDWAKHHLQQGMCIGSVSKQDRTQSNKNVSAIITNALTGITTVFGHDKSSGPIIQGCRVNSSGTSQWAFNIQRNGVWHSSSGKFKSAPRLKTSAHKKVDKNGCWSNSKGFKWRSSQIPGVGDSIVPTYYLDKIGETPVKTYLIQDQLESIIQEGMIAQEVSQLFPRQSTTQRDKKGCQHHENEVTGINYAGFIVPIMMALKEQRQVNTVLLQRIQDLETRIA